MKELIQKVLDHLGDEGEPTEDTLVQCFLDYVDCGAFENLSIEEAEDLIREGEISIKTMCYNLLKTR